MSTTKMNMVRDINGYVTFGLSDSNLKYSIALRAADGPQSFTLPADSAFYELNFSIAPGGAVWVSFNGQNAETPVANTFTATNSSLNPVGRRVPKNTVISVVTNDALVEVGIEIYAV